MRGYTRIVKFAAALACMAGCTPAWSPSQVEFGRGVVQIAQDSTVVSLPVEVAESPDQHRAGLSGRPAGSVTGMIFLFEQVQPEGTGFWMHRTLIPLSLALLDVTGTIREIIEMEPCVSRWSMTCRRYRAESSFHAALEVPAGYLSSRRLGVGARVSLRVDRQRARE